MAYSILLFLLFSYVLYMYMFNRLIIIVLFFNWWEFVSSLHERQCHSFDNYTFVNLVFFNFFPNFYYGTSSFSGYLSLYQWNLLCDPAFTVTQFFLVKKLCGGRGVSVGIGKKVEHKYCQLLLVLCLCLGWWMLSIEIWIKETSVCFLWVFLS